MTENNRMRRQFIYDDDRRLKERQGWLKEGIQLIFLIAAILIPVLVTIWTYFQLY